MTSNPAPMQLTDKQKAEACGILSVGCDRETAANLIGELPEEFAQALQQDSEFAAEVRRTEAGVELFHMNQIHEAAKDKKNWRLSVWWLVQRSPERFATRVPGVVTTRHLKAFLEFFGEGLVSDIRNSEDRDRVQTRLEQLGEFCRQLEDDLWETPSATDDQATDFDIDASTGDADP